MELRELTNQEFNNFTNNFPLKSIYQTQEYGFVMNNQNCDSIFLGLFNNGIVVAATLLLIKKQNGFKYAYAPRGFLINYEDFYLFKEFTDQVKAYLSKNGVVAIKINPMVIRNIYDFDNQKIISNTKYSLIFESLEHNLFHHLGYNNFFEALKPRFEAVIDLEQSEATLFKNIKKPYKTKIRSAISKGNEVYKGDHKQLDILYEFTKDRYIRDLNYYQDCYGYFAKNNMIDYYYTKVNTEVYLRYVQKNLNHYENLSNILSQKIINKAQENPQHLITKKINIDKYLSQFRNELVYATQLLREHPQGIITSAILLVRQGKEVTILMDGDDIKYRKFNSKHFLIWQLIATYKKQGFTKFNLGGISNFTNDSTKYSGLSNFKLSFGALMIEYAGDFELVIHKRNYSLYRTIYQLKNKK